MHNSNDFTRRAFLASSAAGAAGLLSCLAAGQPDAPPRRKPLNVLFLSIDDLNPSLGCYGNPVVRTPNVDALADRGVRFTRAYAQWPSCLPSRVSFLSGWNPPRTRVINFKPRSRDGVLADCVYLPQHFRNNGYFTARLDKVFHIGHDDARSWDLSEEPIKDFAGRPKIVWTPHEIKAQNLEPHILHRGRFPSVRGEKGTHAVVDIPDEKLIDGINARRAIEIMAERARADKPFFLAVGFRRPHLPWIAPRKYFEMYPPENIKLPPRKPGTNDADNIPEDDHRKLIAAYYAAVSFMDARVGEVLAALDRLGLRDNTLVVFFGDQGYCLGERDRLVGKGNLWDRSLHVPLIVAGPGLTRPGQACGAPVGLSDMYPSLNQLCALPAPDTPLDGRSFAPLLTDADAPARGYVLSFNHNKKENALWRSIRTERYRLTENSGGEPVELVDYETDPNEWHNLVEDPARRDTLGRLHKLLAEAAPPAHPPGK
jgi:uncharacterized sulfatase